MLSKRFLFSQAPLFRFCGQRSRLSLKFLFVMVFVGILFQFWAGGFSLATCLGGKMKTQRTYTMFFLHFQVSLWSSFFFPPVLISQDCHNKQPQARWFKEKREFILSQVWSLDVQIKLLAVQSGLSKGSWREIFIAPSSFWCPLVFLGLCQHNLFLRHIHMDFCPLCFL